ncbi:MAG: hypothetical protein SGARI_000195 [Bacillariaceae sp.]
MEEGGGGAEAGDGGDAVQEEEQASVAQEGESPADEFDFRFDARIEKVWEKAMVRAVLGKVKEEQQKTDNLLWEMWGPHTKSCLRSLATVPPDYAYCIVREDTSFVISCLAEANALFWIRQANRIACDRIAEQQQQEPSLSNNNVQAFPLLRGCDFRLIGLLAAGDGATSAFNPFGGTMLASYSPDDAAAARLFHVGFPQVRRLCYRAGVVQIDNVALEYVRQLVLFIIKALLDTASRLDDQWKGSNTRSLQHPAQAHIRQFPPTLRDDTSPDSLRQWQPTPGMMTMVAKAMGMPITTVYEDIDQLSLGINLNIFYDHYCARLSDAEEESYLESMENFYDPSRDYDVDDLGPWKGKAAKSEDEPLGSMFVAPHAAAAAAAAADDDAVQDMDEDDSEEEGVMDEEEEVYDSSSEYEFEDDYDDDDETMWREQLSAGTPREPKRLLLVNGTGGVSPLLHSILKAKRAKTSL